MTDDERRSLDLAFLTGGGKMGQLMRGYDWSRSPLGPPRTWPQSLRSVVGLLMGSKFPMFVAWGDELGFLYNDPYAEILGAKHPKALGARFREIWSEIWPDISPLIRAAMAGEATYRENLPLTMNRRGFDEQTWFTFSYSPVRDERGKVAGMFCACTETTTEVRGRLRRDALLTLDDRLRDVADTAELSYVASELLGEALGAARVGYGVIDPDAGTIVVERNWSLRGFDSVAGLHRFSDYGSYIEDLRRGEPVANADVEQDPRTAGTSERFKATGVRAFLDIPVVEQGRVAAMLFIHSASPRIWTEEEIAFARAFAERTGAAIARRRAEHALSGTEARLAAVVESLPVGVGVVDLEGRLLLANPETQRFLPSGRIPSRDPERVGRWRAWTRSGQPIQPQDFPGARAIRGERVVPGLEMLYTDDDGREIWTTVATVPIKDAEGRQTGHTLAISDVDAIKRTAEALRDSEERFRQLAEAVDQVFYVTDVSHGRLLYLSPAYEKIWGRPAAALIDDLSRFLDSIHPEDRDRVKGMGARQASGEAFEIEYRIVRPDGSVRFIRDRAFPVKTDGLRRFVGVAEDITERRQATARFEGVFNSDLMGFTIFDIETGATLAINDRFLAMTGHSRADFDEGRWDWRDFTVAEHLAKDKAAIAQAREQGFWDPYEKEYRHKRGTIFPVRIASAPLPGEPGRVVVSIEDITERRRATDALKHLNETLEAKVAQRTSELLESQRRVRGIFDAALQFMALLSPDGTVIEVNQTALAWSQIAASDIVGQPFWRAAPMRDSPELQAAIKDGIRRAARGETVREEHEMRGAGDVRATIDFSLKPVPGDDGRAIWILAEGRDITALKEAQEALRQAQKMEAMGQLTGGVAHDFNNLLTPIVGALDRLQRKGLGSEREQRLISGAMQSAERAKVLVQRLLAFARRQPLQTTTVDLSALTRDIAELVAGTTGPQIKVAVDAPADLPPAVCDSNQLEMAILNLAVNARDAMPDGGTLRISVDAERIERNHRSKLKPGRYLRLSVADTGIGMDTATLARAVEPFFSTKGIGKGTGLGLSMVHGLAVQLGGALAISSTPGLGTNVELWLPQGETSPHEAPPAAGTQPIARQKGTVLLVDDEDLIRLSTADMLTELGYSVVEAASAEEALKLLDQGLQPDLVVTDHLMPGMSGTDLARTLKASRAIKVLLISGYADTDGIAADLPRLTKPFRTDELAASIASIASI